MEHTVFLEFEREGQPIDVYSVKLATENPSDGYGILDVTTRETIVNWGHIVTSTTTGRYEYTFTVENGHTYIVSWQVIGNAGDDPTYQTEHVGPFFSVDNEIRACTSYTGTFLPDSTATLMLKVTNFNGLPQNVSNATIAIYDDFGTPQNLEINVPLHVDTGFYVYDWELAEDQPSGKYSILWSYEADGVDKSEVQNVVVSSESTSEPELYSGKALEFRLALEHHLTCAQSIPVYFEQARPTRDLKTYKFTFPRWNQSAGMIVYKNQEPVNSGVTVDYFTGTITFDSALTAPEVVNADYNFKWFSDEDLYRYLLNALQTVNIYPPVSDYSLTDVPDRFIPVILYGAAKDALRHIMMCLQFQQPQQVFGGEEAAQRAFQGFEQLKQNYEKDWEKLLEQKKFGPYPMTRVTVTPEYTLPGGRSRWFRYLFKGGA